MQTETLRRDVWVLIATGMLVAAAVGVGVYLNAQGVPLNVNAPPLLGKWMPHIGIGTPLAVVVALLIISYGPTIAARLAWGRLLGVAWVSSLAWVVSLGLVDGWARLSTRLGDRGEYVLEVPGTGWRDLLGGFDDRILTDAPDNWIIHVAGHPPGALGFFVVLDRIGLSGPVWAGVVCMLLGSSAVVAIAITLRALGSQDVARRALPFLVLTPAALWIGASADAMFLAVSAWGLTLLALATRTKGLLRVVAAFAAGLLLGSCLYLSYGFVLFGLLAVAVFVVSLDWRTILIAAAGVGVVVGLWTVGGFVWWEAYPILVERYYQGVGGERPYSYWVWADLAVLAICVGPGVIVGLARLSHGWSWRSWRLLPGAAAASLVAATLSGMSKAEVERIWLPFMLWLVPACALLPQRHWRRYLVVQAIIALLVQHLIRTRW